MGQDRIILPRFQLNLKYDEFLTKKVIFVYLLINIWQFQIILKKWPSQPKNSLQLRGLYNKLMTASLIYINKVGE